jgi:hypothetical protein
MDDSRRRRRALVEALGAWVVACAVAAVLYRLQGVPFIRANLHALVAAVFLGLPQLLLLRRRGEEIDYGFRLRPVGKGLALAGLSAVIFLPIYAAASYLVYRILCVVHPSWVPGRCARLLAPSLRLPPDFAMLAAAQLVVVALPEELFFRGYLMTRLEEALAGTRRVRIAGVELGWAWLLSSALFALGHLVVVADPGVLLTFFPGLVFGWLFARTRSVLAGSLFHAACNLLVDVLASSLLR